MASIVAAHPALRRRVLLLYRRALRATHGLPASTFPSKTRKNIREMVELCGAHASTVAEVEALVAAGEHDVGVLEQVVQCPEALELFARKPPPRRRKDTTALDQ